MNNLEKSSVHMNTRYTSYFDSPLGRLLLEADDAGLTGLWFEGQKQCPNKSADRCRADSGDGYLTTLHATHVASRPIEVCAASDCHHTGCFDMAKHWLDIYFSGREPDFTVPVHMTGTDFQMDVWHMLCGIPYGKTVTYGDLARRIAEKRGMRHMSAQAVGQAVGRNPISIIVPCHRVIGSDGSLTGYGGGLGNKIKLLKLEEGNVIHYEILEDERCRQ